MMKVEAKQGDTSSRPVGVAEAAAHFGISTLRVRHHLRTGALQGFRDNRGHWLVRIDGTAVLPAGERALDRDTLADMLMEELLEAKDQVEEQDLAIKRLHVIIERQQKVLDRTVAQLETLSAAQAPTDTAATERLRKTLDRVLALLETSVDQQEAANARAERFRAMMARAIQLLENVEPSAGAAAQSGKVSEALGKAIDLGNRAIERAEVSSHHAVQLDGMLERALAVAEQKVEAQKLTEQRLTRRDELLERSLDLIEAASSRVHGKQTMRSRLFSLFGRRARREAG